METVFGKARIEREFRHPVVTFGVFDGFHLGHQKIVSELVRWARERQGEAVLLTFDRHPERVLTGKPPSMMTSLPHRLLFFERAGVDVCIVLKFDKGLAETPAETFLRETIASRIGAKGILIGFNSAFGRGGEGTYDFLRSRAPELGLEVRVVGPVAVNGEPVSSTAIRRAIVEGDLAKARRMLGRRYSVLGTVVEGSGLGARLGFPTANLDLHHEIRPPAGVYAGFALLEGGRRDCLISIGTRPTFQREGIASGEVTIEVHILGWSGDLYGTDLEVEFVQHIRDQIAFPDAEQLKNQLCRDRQAAGDILRRERGENA